jgi:hypothetical protein
MSEKNDTFSKRSKVELTPEEEERVKVFLAGGEHYDCIRSRLKAAGKRVRIADQMRRAAIAEMGQALRDNRAFVADAGPDAASWKVAMDEAASHTMVTRRTLSAAIGDTDTGRASDQELAAKYRDYGYDLFYGGYELHRRYPWLAGVHAARTALLNAVEEETPDELWSLDTELPPGYDVLDKLYRDMVDAIAEGYTGQHTDAVRYSETPRLPFWNGEPPPYPSLD